MGHFLNLAAPDPLFSDDLGDSSVSLGPVDIARALKMGIGITMPRGTQQPTCHGIGQLISSFFVVHMDGAGDTARTRLARPIRATNGLNWRVLKFASSIVQFWRFETQGQNQ